MRSQTYQVAEVAFAPDGLKGTENLLFNHALGEIPRPETFLGRWHRARIAYDLTDYTGSVWIDNEPVLAGVPLRADLDVQASPEISLTRDGALPVEIWIDDVGIEFLDLSRAGEAASELAFRPLFRDNFGRYESSLFPRQGGWRPMRTEVQGEAAEEGAEMLGAAREEEAASIDDRVYASSDKSFKLGGSEEEPGRATKRFSLPERVPFCVSAEPFAVAATGESEPAEGRAISSRDRETRSTRQKRWDDKKEGGTMRPAGRSGPASSKPAAVPVRHESAQGIEEAKLMSGVPVSETFFIYAFDGRLLAEYDVAGALVRDYVYFGGKLIAEYRNAGSQLLYYTSDQINSTRIVTDSSGTVVYAAAHEPYGGIQKTWVTAYDPALKFSGKQRDPESDLDYFGARYYDRSIYRFTSVDPITNQCRRGLEPQLWNLYGYCKTNPVSFMDPDGRGVIPVILPGVGGTALHTYLDSAFAKVIGSWIALSYRMGVNIEFDNGFRSQAEQADIRSRNPRAAEISLHSAGWAVDIKWDSLTLVQQLVVLISSIECGLSWGGNSFKTYYDPVHFFVEPEGDRESLVIKAAMTVAAFDFWGICGLSDQELYMLYGVFTERAAWLVVNQAEYDLR